VQAIRAEILALQADLERRVAHMRAGAERDELTARLDRLRWLRERIDHEGSNISRESAEALVREIRTGIGAS
jgi:hypothetical protein